MHAKPRSHETTASNSCQKFFSDSSLLSISSSSSGVTEPVLREETSLAAYARVLLESATGSIPERQGATIAGREVLPHQEALAEIDVHCENGPER